MEITELSIFIQSIFKNEFLPQDELLDLNKVKNLAIDAKRHGLFNLSADGTELSVADDINIVQQKLAFFKNLLVAYVDSYLVVALTIHNLMFKNITVD